jgi:hypothetical protein
MTCKVFEAARFPLQEFPISLAEFLVCRRTLRGTTFFVTFAFNPHIKHGGERDADKVSNRNV